VTKSPDAFRTISEVAVELELPQHVLRFWESRFPQVKPMKRGGGRRYYRPDDVELLRGIRHLLYGQGYTIRGVQRILREQGPRFVQTVWQEGAPQPELPPEPEAGERERDLIEQDEGPVETRSPPPSPAEIVGSKADATLLRYEAPVPPVPPAPAAAAAFEPPGEPQEHAHPPTAEAVRPALSAESRAQLQDALEQLAACKTMLDQACLEIEQAS
jgi:DNA-binding transcriptional MerR regulator